MEQLFLEDIAKTRPRVSHGLAATGFPVMSPVQGLPRMINR